MVVKRYCMALMAVALGFPMLVHGQSAPVFTRPTLTSKADTINLVLTTPSLKPGGTARPIAGRPGSAQAQNKTVFIGGTLGFLRLGNPAIARPLIATGRIGLYQHAVAMAQLTSAQLSSLLALWSPTGVDPTGGGQGEAEMSLGSCLGCLNSSGTPLSGSNRAALWGPALQYPVEAVFEPPRGSGGGSWVSPAGSVNPGHTYGNFVDPADLSDAQAAINAAKGYGLRSAAFAFTPNGGIEDIDDPFATSGFWANARAIYSYGGGGAVDVPPTYFFANQPELYRQNIVQQMAWLNAQGLRSVIIVSPFAHAADAYGNTQGQAYDANFLENTKKMYYYLKANHALPRQWVVENYASASNSTANVADGSREGLDAVALWLVNAATTTLPGPTRRTP